MEEEMLEGEANKPRRKRSQSAINKAKGNNAETYYAKLFRESGLVEFSKCKTSRFGSKLTDNCGIDLIFIPLNVQIKAGYQIGLNPSSVLKYMNDNVKAVFPEAAPEYSNPNIVIHRKTVGAGHPRTEYDDIVHMSFNTFFNIIKLLYDKGKVPEITLFDNESQVLQELPQATEGECSTEES